MSGGGITVACSDAVLATTVSTEEGYNCNFGLYPEASVLCQNSNFIISAFLQKLHLLFLVLVLDTTISFQFPNIFIEVNLDTPALFIF